jgi:hypothetical protein
MQSSFSQSSSLAASGNNGGDGSTVAVVIDGSKGEGGGQILRNSISYAGILQKELRVHHIRAGRSKPGLRAQHATCLQLAAQVCGGTIQGNTVGSSDIDYIPSHSFDNDNDDNRTEHTLTGDIGTAGKYRSEAAVSPRLACSNTYVPFRIHLSADASCLALCLTGYESPNKDGVEGRHQRFHGATV